MAHANLAKVLRQQRGRAWSCHGTDVLKCTPAPMHSALVTTCAQIPAAHCLPRSRAHAHSARQQPSACGSVQGTTTRTEGCCGACGVHSSLRHRQGRVG